MSVLGATTGIENPPPLYAPLVGWDIRLFCVGAVVAVCVDAVVVFFKGVGWTLGCGAGGGVSVFFPQPVRRKAAAMIAIARISIPV